jgi:hypothetical protein
MLIMCGNYTTRYRVLYKAMSDMPPIEPTNEAPVEARGGALPWPARGGAPPWQKGQSGNPRGTKAGSKHKVTLFVESLLSGEADALVRKLIETAKQVVIVAPDGCTQR